MGSYLQAKHVAFFRGRRRHSVFLSAGIFLRQHLQFYGGGHLALLVLGLHLRRPAHIYFSLLLVGICQLQDTQIVKLFANYL